MAATQQQNMIYQEGRLNLALQAYLHKEFQTLTAAATAYDVPQSTLRCRIEGKESKCDSIAINRLLTPTEEASLLQWILSMDRHGMPLRIATVHEMAGLLVTQCQPITAQQMIGECWIQRFINCHDTLKSKYNHKYDYQHAKCEDLELI